MPKHTGHARRSQSETQAATEAAHGPRPTWSGSLSFGLVTIPVELYPATRPRRRRARMLDEDGGMLQRRFYCPDDGKTLDDSEIARGYELHNGKYVLVEDAELEALEPEKSREIDLRLFTDRQTLDPVMFERAYVLIPGSEGNKAYRLLTQVMQRTGRAGIATFVMREREYIVAIVSDGRCLLAQTLRFADELRPVSELALPKPGAAPKPMAARIERALSSKRARHLDTKQLIDPAHARLEKLIETKRRRGDVVAVAAAETPAEEHSGAEVIDLMQLLKGSLRGRGPKSGANHHRKPKSHAGRSTGKRRALPATKRKRAS